MSAKLLSDLRKDHKTRSLPIRKGDTVLVVKGDFKGHEAKVAEVDRKNLRIYVEGVTRERVDGSTKKIPISPSNVMLSKLDKGDKWRRKILARKKTREGE